MQRDMDLVRQILFLVEAAQQSRLPIPIKIAGRDERTVTYHVRLLAQAGLIEAQAVGDDQWRPLALTWEGHEFLDAARDDTRWNKAKGLLEKAGGEVFSVLKALLISLLNQQISGHP